MLAHALATVKHSGQKRKGSGEDYIWHVMRVASAVSPGRQRTIAFLHDVLEDTDMTAADLRRAGFPFDIVDDVVALSRMSFETYAEFIERTIRDGSDDALAVKLADLADNMDDDWIFEQGDLRARYIKADIQIRRALKFREVKREEKARIEPAASVLS
jgi:(p)ppGpp synthase/HD superfamily hydrolase